MQPLAVAPKAAHAVTSDMSWGKSSASAGPFQGAIANTSITSTSDIPSPQYDFRRIPISPATPGEIRAKLTIDAPGDHYEQEADRVANQVMRMPAPQLQRECACGGSCSECRKGKQGHQHPRLQRKSAGGSSLGPTEAPPLVHQVLRSPGQPLDAATRTFMEPRFGHDFGRIQVHADSQAAMSARMIGAAAYTVENHIVFDTGRYNPATGEGGKLLAHELTHSVQQGERGAPPAVARFSDTGHHVVEEAALPGAGFSESQTKAIEKGNIRRDYSQVGWIGNTALLCQPRDFGGYKPEEHFDNYMWDAVTSGWRTRGAGKQGGGTTPIDYIGSQLAELANQGVNDQGLEHLGNAFHTVEDFFAHSNFVELMQGDTSRGATLITGNPVGPSQSVDRIFEAISSPDSREWYRMRAEEKIAAAEPGTHTAMAHDEPTTRNYPIARRLAALVIQDLGAEVLAVMAVPEPERARLMKERVLAKVVRYLRPPDQKDQWWESLTAADAHRIDRRLDEAARKTPVTVNQCALSPLKNLEASKDSPMALPIGIAIPTTILGNQAWFQVGAGVTRPFPFEPLPGDSRGDGRGAEPIVAAQITGTFP